MTTLDTMGLAMPGNASLTPGLGVSIRTDNFVLEERRVSAVSGSRLTLDQQTRYSIKPGYGYFLTGALWMLDSPGEWYFNPSTGDLYVWMPDGAAPDGRVSLNTLSIGADLKNKAYVDLIGLNIAHVGTGAQLSTATTVRLRNVAISEISGFGIEADSSRSCAVEWSSIAKTGLDAIKAIGGGTKGFTISDSSVTDSGSLARTDGWRKLPRPALAAINVGPNATISRNQIIGSANNGMFLGQDSTVENNRVSRACMVLNDCGGIYTNFAGANASIVGNVVNNIGGGLHGDLTKNISQTAGIYLDDHAHDIKVVGNTVTGAAYGVLIHNAYNSTVSGNLIFGNNRYQIWMQEQTGKVRANGDIYGNRIESNQLVPVAGGPSVFMESYIGDTGDFAVFSNNHYSALLSPRPIGESWPTGSISYNFSEWQASGQDTGGRVSLPVGYASFLSKGGNIVPNGNLANNRTGWTWWNSTAPYGQIAVLNCNFGPCLRLAAGATATILSSPNFSVTAQQWYRVSFDAATSNADQPISVLVRRGGGSANYDPLVPGPESFPGSTDWRRYSFVFQSAQTTIAHDPATGELGARVDFEGIQPGSSITVARLEVVPLTRSEAAMQLRLQLNPSSSSASIPCSPQDEAAGLCDKFVYLTNGSAVNWSSAVEPLSGHAIYSLDTSLVDTDGDGVADAQDACPANAAGRSRGFAWLRIDQ